MLSPNVLDHPWSSEAYLSQTINTIASTNSWTLLTDRVNQETYKNITFLADEKIVSQLSERTIM